MELFYWKWWTNFVSECDDRSCCRMILNHELSRNLFMSGQMLRFDVVNDLKWIINF